MRLSQQLRKQFEQFDRAQPNMSGTVSAANRCGELSYELETCEKIACGVRRLRLRSSRLQECDAADLRSVSENLATRINYLLEPLSLVECDLEGNELQMRSTTPSQSAEGIRYYEMLLGNGEIDFCRYQKANNSERATTTSELTREVMIRLADDLEQALGEK